jgi:hypothetical protein
MTERYIFSGHDTFQCKSLWLKKGYNFAKEGGNYNSPNAVIALGVGKNMVSSIRYWLKAFGLLEDDNLTETSHYIFDNESGRDPYTEDLATLWLLHYLLVSTNHASLYNLTFVHFQKERKEFSTEQLQKFVKRKYIDTANENLYNENTVKKDIEVLLKNYVMPIEGKPFDDYSTLLLELNLIRSKTEKAEDKIYIFNDLAKRVVVPEVLLYALIDQKGQDKTVSFDILQKISLIFCMPILELIETIQYLTNIYPDAIVYTDNAGMKQVQFLKELDKFEVLNHYYDRI